MRDMFEAATYVPPLLLSTAADLWKRHVHNADCTLFITMARNFNSELQTSMCTFTERFVHCTNLVRCVVDDC